MTREKFKRAVSVSRERIERTTTCYKDGSRRQRSKKIRHDKRNPKKFVIDQGGNHDLTSYPYENPNSVFLRVKDAIELFSVDDAIRRFNRWSLRLKRYRLLLTKGVKKRTNVGCAFNKAMQAGFESEFGLQSGKHSLINKTIECERKQKAIAYFSYKFRISLEEAEKMYEQGRRKLKREEVNL